MLWIFQISGHDYDFSKLSHQVQWSKNTWHNVWYIALNDVQEIYDESIIILNIDKNIIYTYQVNLIKHTINRAGVG